MSVLGFERGQTSHETTFGKVVRTVWSTTEFVVDDVPLRGLLDPHLDHRQLVSVFDTWPASDAEKVMRLGDFPEQHWPGIGRIPVLMCPCGDPYCGAFTCRLGTDGDTVTWSDWAFEDFANTAESLPLVPDYMFSAAQYGALIDRVLAQLEASSQPLTVVEGAWRRRSVLSRILRRRTSEADEALHWLDARAVRPSLADPGGASASYLDFLEDLELCQADFAATGLHVPPAARPETLNRLRRILQSPHSISLPTKTLWAVRWLADHLAASSRD